MATHSSILAWRISVDRGTRWASVHRVTKGQTRLKGLSMHPWTGLFIHSIIQFFIQQITERFLCVGAVQVVETQG